MFRTTWGRQGNAPRSATAAKNAARLNCSGSRTFTRPTLATRPPADPPFSARRRGEAMGHRHNCRSCLEQLYCHIVLNGDELVGNSKLTPELIELIAARFKALAEPARLQILTVLRGGEKTVNELVDDNGARTGERVQTPSIPVRGADSSRAGRRGCSPTTISPIARLPALRHHVRPARAGSRRPAESARRPLSGRRPAMMRADRFPACARRGKQRDDGQEEHAARTNATTSGGTWSTSASVILP